MRHRARVALASAGLASLAASSHASEPASAPPVTLVWRAPPGCPSQEDVAAQIHRHLATSRVAARHAAEADVREIAGRWHVALQVRSDAGTSRRTIEGKSCAAVAEATALVLAVGVDPSAALSAPAPPSPPDDAPDAASPVSPESPARPVVWSVSAGLDAHLGLLPAPALGLRAGAGISYGRMSAALEGSLLPGADAGATAHFRAYSFRARGCAVLLERGPLALAPCAGLEVDVLHGQGREVALPRSATAAWIAPLLAARVGIRASDRLSLIVGLDGKIPLERPVFEVSGEPVFQPGPVHGAASVEIRMRL